MRTEALIDMLARGAGPAPRAVVARRLLPAAMGGALAAAALAVGVRGPIPGEMFATAAPWIKLAYASGLAVAAGWLTARLAVPIARLRTPARAVSLVVAAMVVLGALALLLTPAGERVRAFLGQSWIACPWNVLALSLPALGGILWAVRGLAPTRPAAAGFAAGVLAGALGSFGYAFSCPEASAAFVAAWYSLGIYLTGVLGALLGPRLLRW